VDGSFFITPNPNRISDFRTSLDQQASLVVLYYDELFCVMVCMIDDGGSHDVVSTDAGETSRRSAERP